MTHNPLDKRHIILDLDSTNVETHGHQDESTYIYHYDTTGYHPMVLYDGLTGDLMKFMLRKGSEYTSTGVVNFLEPVLFSLRRTYPKAMILSVAYSLVNTMKQLVLPKEFSKSRMSTLRTIFIKIAGKTVSHAKKMSMRLCSSAPYKEAILKIFENIHLLALG
ncbi:Transposase DDE domain group 1 [Proteiniclasticum ruminis]|uniref:Transposase DDE domain group 1 n=2 Tax=Proteiniclasticum ruminis TaxID=398199 RepID=A0A1I5DR16_9CLOT|nr:transposase [Proteiniclasticum ruminis]SFO01520.1 Transposase DDE domain group 1 [Proteiniclasticum ruminis]